jgi:hypothetical protein
MTSESPIKNNYPGRHKASKKNINNLCVLVVTSFFVFILRGEFHSWILGGKSFLKSSKLGEAILTQPENTKRQSETQQ